MEQYLYRHSAGERSLVRARSTKDALVEAFVSETSVPIRTTLPAKRTS